MKFHWCFCNPTDLLWSIPFPFPYLFISWLIIILTSITWFVLGCWLSIVFNFTSIYQNIIYLSLGFCIRGSLLFTFLICRHRFVFGLFYVFKHKCTRYLYAHSNPSFGTIKLCVLKAFIFCNNSHMLLPGE